MKKARVILNPTILAQDSQGADYVDEEAPKDTMTGGVHLGRYDEVLMFEGIAPLPRQKSKTK